MKIEPSRNKEFRLQDAGTICRYIHSNNGVLTLTDPSETISHSYLFKIPKSGFPSDVCFAYCVHEDKLFYLGMAEMGKFRLTKNSRFDKDTEIVKGAAYIVKMAYNDNLAKMSPMILTHSGRCAKCGRKLTSEFGIKHGFGRKCIDRVVTGQKPISLN